MTATMDFFGAQDQARRKTGWLVFYFVAAVLTIIVAIYSAVALALGFADAGVPLAYGIWNAELFLAVAGVTSLIVLGGTLFKLNQLRGPDSGVRVATMLGGRLVSPNTDDPQERKLLNFVEEMAIASGTTVPPVYVIDEDAINAFAAGTEPSDAVIAVTNGAMRILDREELQGVVAHEFSHILNGDMRLIIRLMGVLHGIVVLVIIGAFLLRVVGMSRMSRRSSSKKDGKGNGLVFLAMVIGISFVVFGWIGEFFANLIKMAVSRQREFLADASAVQFARSPRGIAGALRKIGGYSSGSRLTNANTKSASHLFFADGLKRSFSELLSTHPNLAVRIKRVDPAWDEEYPSTAMPSGEASYAGAAGVSGFAAQSPAAAQERDSIRVDPDEVVRSVGAPQPEHVEQAAVLLGSLPEELRTAGHEPFGARAVVYGLLLDRNDNVRRAQMRRLASHADDEVLGELERLAPALMSLPAMQRLPLLEMALPSLRQLSEDQYTAFVENMEFLISADDHVSVFEFALRQLVIRQYRLAVGKGSPARGTYRSVRAVASQVRVLLSVLAWFGSERDQERSRGAFGAAVQRLDEHGAGLQPLEPGELSLKLLEESLETLTKATPLVKRRIVDASAACIAHDRSVTIEEAELLRAIGAALDCPIPVLLPGEMRKAA